MGIRGWGAWIAALLFSVAPLFGQGGPSPRHAPMYNYPGYPDMVNNVAVRTAIDQWRDVLPGSTGHLYYNVTAGNPHGAATIANKATWVQRSSDWIAGKVTGWSDDFGSFVGLGTAAIEDGIEWVDDHVQPEILMPEEMAENFHRAFKAYQIYRQMTVMSKSWSGSLFKIDLLDVLPTFDMTSVDQYGAVDSGVRVGLKYKDKNSRADILSANGLDNPFLGSWDRPRFSYKGPRSLSDVDFQVEASPYAGVVDGNNSVLRAGQSGLEMIDRVWYEGVLGRDQADRGVYYNPRIEDYRSSPKLLKERAERVGTARLSQIDQEIGMWASITGKSTADIQATFQPEINYWSTMGDRLYEGQVRRINRLRDELQKTQNATIQNESLERLKNSSQPKATGFLDSAFNTIETLGKAATDLRNAVTGDEAEGEDTGPRMVFKAQVAYAQATHGAYLEAKAIREILYSKLKAAAQTSAADGFVRMQKELKKRLAEQERLEAALTGYTKGSNETLDLLADLGVTPADVHARIEELRTK